MFHFLLLLGCTYTLVNAQTHPSALLLLHQRKRRKSKHNGTTTVVRGAGVMVGEAPEPSPACQRHNHRQTQSLRIPSNRARKIPIFTTCPGSISFSHFHQRTTHTIIHVTRNTRSHTLSRGSSTRKGASKTEAATLIQGNSRCNRGESTTSLLLTAWPLIQLNALAALVVFELLQECHFNH
uniref:Putative secreted protein n=1 Tax=Anopheles darlingi TaxID=43151 RepID=A0A2M4DD12_ANODA